MQKTPFGDTLFTKGKRKVSNAGANTINYCIYAINDELRDTEGF